MTGLNGMFSLADVLRATGGRVISGATDAVFAKGVSTDTRTLKEGDLFVALKGPRYDGHDFLTEALKRGAAGAIISVVSHRIPQTELERKLHRERVIIGVQDTLSALQGLARFHRNRFDLPVVAVSGSNGKTTTKEMAAWILSRSREVLKNDGNLNNQIGVPITLFRLGSQHQIAVVEVGINQRGELRLLADIVQPNVGVITNIGPTHLEMLGSLEGVATAKSELLDSLPGGDGIAILNRDDPFFDFLKAKCPGPVVTFGLGQEAQVRGFDIGLNQSSETTFKLAVDPQVMGIARGGEQNIVTQAHEEIRLPIPGIHNVMNALAAAAVGAIFGCHLGQIKEALESFQMITMRSQLLEWRGARIVNDAYNANPASMQAALEMLAMFKTDGQRVAVLGDMLELGAAAQQAHDAVGDQLSKISGARLIAVGSLARSIAESARASGMPGDRITWCENADKAVSAIKKNVKEGDIVLVKGSRGIHLERVVDRLMGVD